MGSLRKYALMVKWQALSNKPMLPLYTAVEVMIAVGFIIGLGFFYPEIDPTTAKFLTTGAPTIILLMVGLVVVPQMVAMARVEGTFDYMWSLPVPRMIYIAADATIWTYCGDCPIRRSGLVVASLDECSGRAGVNAGATELAISLF